MSLCRKTFRADLSEMLAFQGSESRRSRIEPGERRVDVLEFIEIAKAANLDPLDLMGRVLKGVGEEEEMTRTIGRNHFKE